MATTHGCNPATIVLVVLVAAMSTGLVEIEANLALTNCCPPMYMDCDNNATNGCETNIVGDVENCGACGTPCYNVTGPPLNRTRVLCSNGICVYLCDWMTGDCDYDIMSNGCETDLSGVDPNNCGECATRCADYTSWLPHAQADAPYYYVVTSAGDRMRSAIFQFITILPKWLILGLALVLKALS